MVLAQIDPQGSHLDRDVYEAARRWKAHADSEGIA
jgi:hypothetical protein